MVEIRNNNAFTLWKEGLSHILSSGLEYTDNDHRTCREVMNFILVLEKEGLDTITIPIDTMISSRQWLYPSKEELANIMFKKAKAPAYEYTYGSRIFNYNDSLDQLDTFVIPLLRKDPQSRRAIVSMYDPITDSISFDSNTPGMMYFQFRIHQDVLITNAHIRSNDVFFGWPANLFQISRLHSYLAEKLDVEAGDINIISNSAHVFMEDIEHINTIINDPSF